MKNLIRTLVVAVFLTVMTSMSAFAQNATEATILDKVNQIRTSYGLSTLRYDASLENASSVRASEITVKFSHTRPDGSDWYTVNEDLVYGENLAEGYKTADDVVDAWMASPEHKANILKSDYTTMSVSMTSKDGRNYWAQEFGVN